MPEAFHVFDCPDAISAVILPGLEQGRAVENPGDGLLIDLGSKLFAVSDAPPRSPGASIKFLNQLRDAAADWPAGREASPGGPKTAAHWLTEFTAWVEMEMALVSPFESCTLTALLFVETDDGPRGLAVHTGDSLLFHYSRARGFSQVSKTNFWMVGRSRKLFQAEIMDLTPDSVFLLASDGLLELIYRSGFGPRDLGELMAGGGVKQIRQAVCGRFEMSDRDRDDVALLVLSPAHLPDCRNGFVMRPFQDPGGCRCPEGRKFLYEA